jgi:hypothetical protein
LRHEPVWLTRELPTSRVMAKGFCMRMNLNDWVRVEPGTWNRMWRSG